jgi:hypothetical protein
LPNLSEKEELHAARPPAFCRRRDWSPRLIGPRLKNTRLSATECAVQNLPLAIVRFGMPVCRCRTRNSRSAAGTAGLGLFWLSPRSRLPDVRRVHIPTHILRIRSIVSDRHQWRSEHAPRMLFARGRHRDRSRRTARLRSSSGRTWIHPSGCPDHVLGVNPSSDHGGRRIGTTVNAYHDPFVLFGFCPAARSGSALRLAC